MASDSLSEIRRGLDTERAGLQERLDDLGRGDGSGDDTSLAFDDNFADSGQVAAEQGEVHAIASQLRDQLRDVETALAKLDDGSYGKCDVCGQSISEARLEAMPAANTCIEHA